MTKTKSHKRVDKICQVCGTQNNLGIIRGRLCNNCNTALGLLSDDPERIRKLADYISAVRE